MSPPRVNCSAGLGFVPGRRRPGSLIAVTHVCVRGIEARGPPEGTEYGKPYGPPMVGVSIWLTRRRAISHRRAATESI